MISAVSTLIRELVFEVTSQRIGKSIRMKLFEALIRNDVPFYDNFRTREMLSRLSSDTQVIQDGLTTAVSAFVKSTVVAIGTIIILFTYDWRLALIIVAVVAPQIAAQRISNAYLQAFTVGY